MNKKNRFEKWGQVREKGKKHYIIYHGVLGWGLSTGILFFILGQMLDYGLNVSEYFTGDWMLTFLIGLVCFLFVGVIFGYFMWGINERFYFDKYLSE